MTAPLKFAAVDAERRDMGRGARQGGRTRARRSRRTLALALALVAGGLCAAGGSAAAAHPPRAHQAAGGSAAAAHPPKAHEAVVGGSKTSIERWPWQVAVTFSHKVVGGSPRWRLECGGSLVAPRIVLTAAHCALERGWIPASALSVVSGRTRLDGAGGSETGVKKVWAFTDRGGNLIFDPSRNTSDVLLLQLAAPADATPIKIAGPSERAAWSPGSPAWATGWGVTKEGGVPVNHLRAVQLAIDRDSTCAGHRSYGSHFDPSVMVCASAPGRDTCQGDSGGPLVVPVAGTYRLVGDTSFGSSCASARYPGVYGRIAGQRLRGILREGVTELGGVDPIGGETPPTPVPLDRDAARAAVVAQARHECNTTGPCHRQRTGECTSHAAGYSCKVREFLEYNDGYRQRCAHDLLVASRAGAPRIAMTSGTRCNRGWKRKQTR